MGPPRVGQWTWCESTLHSFVPTTVVRGDGNDEVRRRSGFNFYLCRSENFTGDVCEYLW